MAQVVPDELLMNTTLIKDVAEVAKDTALLQGVAMRIQEAPNSSEVNSLVLFETHRMCHNKPPCIRWTEAHMNDPGSSSYVCFRFVVLPPVVWHETWFPARQVWYQHTACCQMR